MKLTVAIATAGRPDIMAQAIGDLGRQSRPPDRIVVSAPASEDVGPVPWTAPPVEILLGTRGLTRQRNAVLDALEDEDAVLFLDDDFVMAPDYLAELDALLTAAPEIVAVTGTVLADGIKTRGISHDAARTLLTQAAPIGTGLHPVNNGYGCNMAFRVTPIRDHGPRFDERLPLYGWLEDVDFSRKVARHGRCVRAEALRGVHLGTKGGRTSGLRLGYSQIANPAYLTRQSTMRPGHAIRLAARNVAANLGRALWPEPWVDRRGRLRGNLLALGDLMRGRVDPGRILSLGDAGRGTS
ncbi:glycosyltransferase family 2 protein [Jannaschia marina]|uniref:glycosyltransferase family 2 protein n=1 Tax=Jannaschia marina TaxID=2741674 RepID=UPI0015C6CB27|nr:glycosyltransferase [Jannaschia marina]